MRCSDLRSGSETACPGRGTFEENRDVSAISSLDRKIRVGRRPDLRQLGPRASSRSTERTQAETIKTRKDSLQPTVADVYNLALSHTSHLRIKESIDMNGVSGESLARSSSSWS